MKITMLTRMLSQIGLNFMNCHHKKINSAPALSSHHFFWCSLIKLGKMKKKRKKKEEPTKVSDVTLKKVMNIHNALVCHLTLEPF